MATVLRSFVKENPNGSFELFELWLGVSMAPGQTEKDFLDAERFILSTMCDKGGIPLTDEEGNRLGCGSVHDPAVLPEEIQDWWLGVVPGAAPAS